MTSTKHIAADTPEITGWRLEAERRNGRTRYTLALEHHSSERAFATCIDLGPFAAEPAARRYAERLLAAHAA